MAIISSKFVNGPYRMVGSINAGQVSGGRAFIQITAAQLILNNIFEMLVLPANHKIIDAILDSDDLDSNVAPLITLDVGVMSGTPGDVTSARTCGSEIFAGTTIAQQGVTSLVRPTSKTEGRLAAVGYDRSIGVLVKTAPATAAAGEIGLTLLMAP